MKHLTIALALIASPAIAEPICAERSIMVAALKSGFDEVPLMRALTADGQLIEVFFDPTDESWTMLLTKPGDDACAIADGFGLVWIKPGVPG